MEAGVEGRVFVDLHCHSAASFDSLSPVSSIVRTAVQRGLTHLAITDHERLDGALEARDMAPPGLEIIVGEEVRSTDGDVIGLYLTSPVPPGLSALETVAAIHEQGGLAGIPHPFDRFRASGLAGTANEQLERLAAEIDYVEAFNARVPYAAANERAAAFARSHKLAGVAASDAHSLLEVGIAYTVLPGPISGADDLRAALTTASLVTGRASFLARGMMPLVKVIQRLRGNRRIEPAGHRSATG